MTNLHSTPAIELIDVSKCYRTYSTPRDRLKEILSFGNRDYARRTNALKNVSFSLEKGGRLGIVGENGSGKSTLLKVLAGVLTPSSGEVKVYGRVSALLELGAGFNPELSGNENIRQFCMLHGMHQQEIELALPEIVMFSELKDAISHPVKTYSSGMAMRLGFACAVYVKPEILIVDEALSVGDSYFQNKCLHKIKSMLDDGVTFIYVTHAADAIRSLCNNGIWLDKGTVRLLGSSSEVGAAYEKSMFSKLVRAGLKNDNDNYEKNDSQEQRSGTFYSDAARRNAFLARVEPLRTGSGEIRINDICLVDSAGMETDSVKLEGQVRIRVFFQLHHLPPEQCALSVGINDTYGRQILHFNSSIKGIYASMAPLHIEQMIEFSFENILCPNEYSIVAGIGTLENHPQTNGFTVTTNVVDYCVGGARFSVKPPEQNTNYDLWGIVKTDYTVSLVSLD